MAMRFGTSFHEIIIDKAKYIIILQKIQLTLHLWERTFKIQLMKIIFLQVLMNKRRINKRKMHFIAVFKKQK